MANLKISELTVLAALSSGDVIPIVSGGGTKQITITNLFATVPVPILLPNGTAAAPSLAFAGLPNMGIWTDGSKFAFAVGGAQQVSIRVGSLDLDRADNFELRFGASNDVILIRDAANTLALRNANAEQQFNIYSGNGAYGLIKSKQELVTTTAAATAVTAATFIPDGAIPLAISTYVQTAITTAGLTGYNIGDGADADRWGAITGDIVGTKSNNSDWTATTIQAFIAAQAITLTAVGANFPAGGKIRVCMTYIMSSEPTS